MRHRRVLTVAMASQVDLALERFVAQAAGERLVAGVLAHVRDQVRRLAERFAAHDALVRLLTCAPSDAKNSHQLGRFFHSSINDARERVFTVLKVAQLSSASTRKPVKKTDSFGSFSRKISRQSFPIFPGKQSHVRRVARSLISLADSVQTD